MNQNIKKLIEIFFVALRLGANSFGGPSAHIGYFHREYVVRKKWLDDEQFADLVSVAQLLPGPASSQIGIGIGVLRGGKLGGFLSFCGFTLPSVILLMCFVLFFGNQSEDSVQLLHGFKLVSVAVVSHAVMVMWRQLITDTFKSIIALVTAVVIIYIKVNIAHIILIIISGIVSYFYYQKKENVRFQFTQTYQLSKKQGFIHVGLFFFLLFMLPIVVNVYENDYLIIFDKFYRSGALVFGGGHVVLPLLESEFVSKGFLSQDQFLSGYALTQAMPGPLFTFSSYIGTIIKGLLGGIIATVAIFLPSFLLMYGVLPFWSSIRNNKVIYLSLMGVNASVVGLLLATLYQPIWASSVSNYVDVIIIVIIFILLRNTKVPMWIIIVVVGIVGLINL